MNDDVTDLRAMLPAYAGHADASARRLSDQQIRAWTGEALVDLQDRVALDGLQERFDALLMRCEFGDQHVIKALEKDAFERPDAAAAVEKHDVAIASVAAQLKSVAADNVAALLAELEHAFDARATAVLAMLKG